MGKGVKGTLDPLNPLKKGSNKNPRVAYGLTKILRSTGTEIHGLIEINRMTTTLRALPRTVCLVTE